MASSFNNRHWPSMFRSKHAAEPWQAAQPDISSSPPPSSLLSGGGNTCTNTTGGSYLKQHPSSSYAGGAERTPDPKPRWNPRPEQIRILEAIFNSGMVNPPRDEIPRIRMRLQEYGQVGDANVFYWFQNRKSRSKNKLRAAAGRPSSWPARAPFRGPSPAAAAPPVTPPPPPATTAPPQLMAAHQQQQAHLLASPAQAAPTSSSSSSSDRSSGSSRPTAKRAAPAMSSPTAVAMDLLGPLAAACPQMYCQGQPMAPPHKARDLVVASDDEPVFQPSPQGCCLSAAEVAAILGGQYMHVPAQQQPPAAALPAGAFLGLCNEEAGPGITTGQRSCAVWGAELGQYCPGGGADHHQLGLGKTSTAAAREVVHDDPTKLGLLQYCCFGDSAAVAAASVAATSPLAATTPDAAVTVASVAAATTAGLTGLPASSAAPNGVVANYDLLQLQGLAAGDGALGVVGVTTTTSTGAHVAVAAAAPAAAQEQEGGVAALWITDSVTGRSVAAHSVVAARLDVRAQFGEAAVLFRCAGERGLDLEHVPVDASGCTVQPLQHGAFYYVLV